MTEKQKRLGDILIEKGLINNEQLNKALDEQKITKKFLGEILLERKLIEEKDLLKALSKQFNIPFVSIKYKYIDWNLVNKFSPSLVVDQKCFPLEADRNYITFAITNPLDAWAREKAEKEVLGFKIKFVLVCVDDMNDALQRYREYMRIKYIPKDK